MKAWRRGIATGIRECCGPGNNWTGQGMNPTLLASAIAVLFANIGKRLITGSTSLSESATKYACWPTDVYLDRRLGRPICRSIAYQLLISPHASIYDRQRVINWLYHDIDSAHTADVHLLSQALWPSTPCLIICVIHQSTLQRLRDHWKLTCSLLTSTLSALEVLPRNALDKSTYLITYLLYSYHDRSRVCLEGHYNGGPKNCTWGNFERGRSLPSLKHGPNCQVTSLGGGGRTGGPPRVTPSRGCDSRMKKKTILWLN